MTTMTRTIDQPTRRRSALTIAAAAAAGLAIWVLAQLLSVELTVGKGPDATEVGAVQVLLTSVVAGLAAWGVRALLARYRADGWWPFVGSTALAVSMIGPSYRADGIAGVVLICMHLAVGFVVISGLMGTTSLSRPDGSSS
jgi:hypothetical protein